MFLPNSENFYIYVVTKHEMFKARLWIRDLLLPHLIICWDAKLPVYQKYVYFQIA